jgi:hypothetical protein
MDEQGEAFFKLIFYMMIAPFWLAWHAIRLSWKFIAVPLIEHGHERAASAASERQSAAVEPARHAREEARTRQLKALKAAVPTTPLERMRATIQLNEMKQPRAETVHTPHLIGEDTFTIVEKGEDFKFAIDMILELTETERAIIKQYELDDVVLEDNPAFTEEQLRDMRVRHRTELDATKDPLLKEITKQSMEMAQSMAKTHREQTRVGDLLVSPYSRVFDTPHQAKEFADKLKTQFLPQIRKLIDSHADAKRAETLEF